MPQWLGEFFTVTDLCSIPSTHIGWHITTCNSSSRRSYAFKFALPYTYRHIMKNKNKSVNKKRRLRSKAGKTTGSWALRTDILTVLALPSGPVKHSTPAPEAGGWQGQSLLPTRPHRVGLRCSLAIMDCRNSLKAGSLYWEFGCHNQKSSFTFIFSKGKRIWIMIQN